MYKSLESGVEAGEGLDVTANATLFVVVFCVWNFAKIYETVWPLKIFVVALELYTMTLKLRKLQPIINLLYIYMSIKFYLAVKIVSFFLKRTFYSNV